MGAPAGILHFELGPGDYETIIAITHSKLAAESFRHCMKPSQTQSKLLKLKLRC